MQCLSNSNERYWVSVDVSHVTLQLVVEKHASVATVVDAPKLAKHFQNHYERWMCYGVPTAPFQGRFVKGPLTGMGQAPGRP